MTRPEGMDPGRILRRRRLQVLSRRGWMALGARVLVLLLLFWLLFSQVFLVHQLEGSGMYPALKDGDLLFGFRLQKEYRSDDVVLYEHGGKLCLGRVVATGSDFVDFDGEGKFFVNGGLQVGEILYPTYPPEGGSFPLRVPEGSVYVLGDYRTQTKDSRDFGPIPMEDIQGKLIGFLRRRGI